MGSAGMLALDTHTHSDHIQELYAVSLGPSTCAHATLSWPTVARWYCTRSGPRARRRRRRRA
eukprot:336820-Prymnesium_polylepis.1